MLFHIGAYKITLEGKLKWDFVSEDFFKISWADWIVPFGWFKSGWIWVMNLEDLKLSVFVGKCLNLK